MNRAIDPDTHLDMLAQAFAAEGCRIAARHLEDKRRLEAAAPPVNLPPPEVVQKLVETVVVHDGMARPSLKLLLRAVSIVTGITPLELVSERRFVPTVRARMIFFTVARELTGRSLPAIGKACGGRDHTTVLHGLQKVAANRAAYEPELSRVLNHFAPRDGRGKPGC